MTTTLKTLMMRLKLQRTAAAAAAAAAVVARAPSPQANERRMAKRHRRKRLRIRGKINNNTCCFKFTARRRCAAGPMCYYSFCIVYKYVVLSAGTKEVPRVLCLICHTPRRFQANKNIVWIALDDTF